MASSKPLFSAPNVQQFNFKENTMQDYTLTVISKTGDTHDYVIYAATLDAAIDKMLDKISYDVREIHTEDEIIIC